MHVCICIDMDHSTSSEQRQSELRMNRGRKPKYSSEDDPGESKDRESEDDSNKNDGDNTSHCKAVNNGMEHAFRMAINTKESLMMYIMNHRKGKHRHRLKPLLQVHTSKL